MVTTAVRFCSLRRIWQCLSGGTQDSTLEDFTFFSLLCHEPAMVHIETCSKCTLDVIIDQCRRSGRTLEMSRRYTMACPWQVGEKKVESSRVEFFVDPGL